MKLIKTFLSIILFILLIPFALLAVPALLIMLSISIINEIEPSAEKPFIPLPDNTNTVT